MIFIFQKHREDFSRFDGLEVSPVQKTDEINVERISRQELSCTNNVFWSVYGHFHEGHVECLKDFKTEKDAMKFAEILITRHQNLSKYGILMY